MLESHGFDNPLTYRVWETIVKYKYEHDMWHTMYGEMKGDEKVIAGFLCQALRDYWKPVIVNKSSPAARAITGFFYQSINWNQIATRLVSDWRKAYATYHV